MFKFNAGRIESRLSNLLGFGFSEENLVRLKLDDPILIKGSDLDVEGCDFVIFYSEGFESRFEKISKMLSLPTPKDNIKVLHIDESFYLVPLSRNGQTIYVIGLNDISYEKLRSGSPLSFRMRIIEGEGDNIEVMMFWGQTEDSMKKQFINMIGPRK